MKALLLILCFLPCILLAQEPGSFEIYEGDTINYTNLEGNKEGIWLEFHDEGGIKKRTSWRNGTEHGGESGFYKNGNVRYTIIWNNGVPHGFYQIYYQSGAIKQSGVWRNDKNVGNLVEYYEETGTVKARTNYNSVGEKEGAVVYYFQNEIIMKVQLFENDIQNGFELNYDSLGNVLEVRKYRNGHPIKHAAKEDELKGVLDYVADQNRLVFVRDSLRKQQGELEIAKVEAQAEIDSQKAKLESEKTQRIYLYAGLGLLVIFGGFMYNRFRVTAKQKTIIESQKEEVQHQKAQIEESHKEITDSIAYAKRIQSAILPPNSLVNEKLKNSFILYKPKDVVAGDFYWLEEHLGKTLFAAADCTGHGVPGAMVSVICNGALNRSVREFGLTDPGKILDQARKIVIGEFEKSEEEVKDGMDIALCSLDGLKLEYAGANNPLWIVRKGEIIETKADKQPIGKYDHPTPYTTHTIDLEPGDSIYIFSDGYVDQFGGEKGKKFKTKALRNLLLEANKMAMDDQKDFIDQAFENWRGNHEQIDDVCIIGVRV